MSAARTVRTQAELDAALADAGVKTILIGSPRGVWLRLGSSGSATVRAYDSATVRAGSHVAVHLHSARAHISGGVVIDHTAVDLTDPATWCAYHGVPVVDGRASLHKAVDAEMAAGQDYLRTVYTVGADLECPDWRDDHECGGGLHLSPRPWQAGVYGGYGSTGRYLRCTVDLAELRCIDGSPPKAKARRLRVEAEVDRFGRDMSGEQS